MPLGQQIVLDLYNCNLEKLSAREELEAALRKIMGDESLPVRACLTQPHDDGEGFFLALFHQYGHIVVHTFPSLGYASADALSTLADAPLNKTAVKLRQALQAEKVKSTFLRRGDFGSVNDMKPTIKKHTKAWRRVRNTRDKMISIIKNKQPSVD